MKIGIPRALFYFKYGLFWEKFFSCLDIEIVTSPKTNKEILDKGLKKVSSEICLPVKIICGHIEYLKDKVDVIFLPRFIELNNSLYTCPKMIGIVDIAKIQVGTKCGILAPRIKNNFMLAHFLLGLKLTKNPLKTKQALVQAKSYLTQHGKEKATTNHKQPEILLLSHFYNLGDDFIGKDIITSFENYGFKTTSKEEIAETILKSDQGFAKNIKWVYERELYNAFRYSLDKVNGICNIISFGCGPDSLISEIMAKEANERKVPFMQLVIDEHTSKTGLFTRIEAFIDILKRAGRERAESRASHSSLLTAH
jgi:predicted nucleotide-binding protein (sugar kinase/HSP70/actin superfamily)